MKDRDEDKPEVLQLYECPLLPPNDLGESERALCEYIASFLAL